MANKKVEKSKGGEVLEDAKEAAKIEQIWQENTLCAGRSQSVGYGMRKSHNMVG